MGFCFSCFRPCTNRKRERIVNASFLSVNHRACAHLCIASEILQNFFTVKKTMGRNTLRPIFEEFFRKKRYCASFSTCTFTGAVMSRNTFSVT
jgi:hypothetical protein